jgi:hypothetical protein
MKPEVEEWDEEEEIDTSGVAMPWRDDHWFNFYWIAEKIQEREGVSRGVAERTLRELCATGDVRSVRCDASSEDFEEVVEPEIVRPSDGLRTKLILRMTDRKSRYV